jgi:hypothetical protein
MKNIKPSLSSVEYDALPALLLTSATRSSVTLIVCAIISPAVRLMSLASLASVGADRRSHSFAELPPPAAPFSTDPAPRCCKMASARFVFSTILKIQFSICKTVGIVNCHDQWKETGLWEFSQPSATV